MQENQEQISQDNTEEAQGSPPPSPRMVDAAFQGFQLAYDLQDTFNNAMIFSLKEAPTQEALYTRAHNLMAQSNHLMEQAFFMGRRYNELREQQREHERSNSSSATAKPKF